MLQVLQCTDGQSSVASIAFSLKNDLYLPSTVMGSWNMYVRVQKKTVKRASIKLNLLIFAQLFCACFEVPMIMFTMNCIYTFPSTLTLLYY